VHIFVRRGTLQKERHMRERVSFKGGKGRKEKGGGWDSGQYVGACLFFINCQAYAFNRRGLEQEWEEKDHVEIASVKGERYALNSGGKKDVSDTWEKVGRIKQKRESVLRQAGTGGEKRQSGAGC